MHTRWRAGVGWPLIWGDLKTWEFRGRDKLLDKVDGLKSNYHQEKCKIRGTYSWLNRPLVRRFPRIGLGRVDSERLRINLLEINNK